MLRILHLVNHLRKTGNGIVNDVVDLAQQQREDGQEVYVASEGGDYESHLEGKGVRCVHLAQRKPSDAVWALGKLRKLLDQERIDVIHAHMMSGVVLAYIARRGTKVALVSTVHNSWQRHADLMRLADVVVTASHAVRDEMAQRWIPASKITVVHYGLGEPSQCVKHEVTGVDLRSPAIITVAGLYERKGVFDLLDAAHLWKTRQPRPHLYFAGEGPERERVRARINALDLDGYVHLLGFRSDVLNLVSKADVFILASHAEPFGLVLLEARRVKCPIVATNVGGIPEVLEGGRAGMLVPAKDPNALANAAIRLLDDPPTAENLANKAAAGLDYWTSERMSKELFEVYQQAISIRHTSRTSIMSSSLLRR